MTWPVNYIEQRLYVNKLLKQKERLQKISKPVILHSLFEPSRSAWETAFVTQTGFGLPIEPGTKLIWMDSNTGQAKTFTTVYDLEGGDSSSGDIHEYISTIYNRGAFRLLASTRGFFPLKDVLYKSKQTLRREGQNYVGSVLPLDFVRESKRGLVSLLLFYKVAGEIKNTSFSMGQPVLFLRSSSSVYWRHPSNPTAYSIAESYMTNAAITNPGAGDVPQNVTGLTYGKLLSGVIPVPGLDQLSPQYEYGTGMIKMDVISQIRAANGMPLGSGAGMGYQGLVTGFSSLAANAQEIDLLTLRIFDPLPNFDGIGFFFIVPNSGLVTNAFSESKAFVYGFYENNTQLSGSLR